MTNSDNGNKVFQYLNEKLIGNIFFPWDREKILPFYADTVLNELQDVMIKTGDVNLIAKRLGEFMREHGAGFTQHKETFINILGYMLLQEEKIALAIQVFEFNNKLHPSSANTYDSLGDAYFANGDDELAILSFNKSLELNPKNGYITGQLQKLETIE